MTHTWETCEYCYAPVFWDGKGWADSASPSGIDCLGQRSAGNHSVQRAPVDDPEALEVWLG